RLRALAGRHRLARVHPRAVLEPRGSAVRVRPFHRGVSRARSETGNVLTLRDKDHEDHKDPKAICGLRVPLWPLWRSVRRRPSHGGGVAVLRGGLKNGVFTTFAATR